jgi:Winged helix DNA-binding domain
VTISLTFDQVLLLRLRAQQLTPRQSGAESTVASIVKDVGGIQAQDASAAALAVRVRSTGLVATNIQHARVQDRSVVRTWGPRGTLHLLPTDDLGWLLPLLGPVFIAGDRRRREELGLDEDICERAISIIRDMLERYGSLTRAEIVEHLAVHDIRLEGQARPHLLARAALEGVICLGPDRGAEPTYVLLNDWIDQNRRGKALSENSAHAELTRRYLKAYGPATPQDQAAWSGMSISKIRATWQLITDELIEVKFGDQSAWMLKTDVARLDKLSTQAPIVRLLPRFDTYLLGYQKRDLVVPSQHAKRVNAGGGILQPAVLFDGRVIGTWKSKLQKNQLDIMLEPFNHLPTEVHPELEVEVRDIARFLDVKTKLHLLPLP